MKITVQNLTQNLLSTDIGLLNPSETKSQDMAPFAAYKAAEGLKALVDAGRVRVTVGEEPNRLDALEPATLGVGGLAEADITITAAEMLALNATPKTLIAAPGTGRAIIFEGAVLYMGYVSAAYAGIAAGEDLAFKYTNGSGLQVGGCETTGFLDQTSSQTRYVRAFGEPASGLLSGLTPVANAALVLHMLTGEITTGDSPLKLKVYYRVVPTTL